MRGRRHPTRLVARLACLVVDKGSQRPDSQERYLRFLPLEFLTEHAMRLSGVRQERDQACGPRQNGVGRIVRKTDILSLSLRRSWHSFAMCTVFPPFGHFLLLLITS